VASALAAIGIMRASGLRPTRPVVVVVFPEEEGSRFGLPCLGSGLMTGTVSVERVLGLKDDDGNTFADLLVRNGIDPDLVGPDPEALSRITSFVELHVEQGRGLVDLCEPVAIGRSIIGHGRWKLRFEGQGNHAGTTLMTDRQDPMIAAAGTILAAGEVARELWGAGRPSGR
jgi:N-carbamoyl-L-amino-acid hydrolase